MLSLEIQPNSATPNIRNETVAKKYLDFSLMI